MSDWRKLPSLFIRPLGLCKGGHLDLIYHGIARPGGYTSNYTDST